MPTSTELRQQIAEQQKQLLELERLEKINKREEIIKSLEDYTDMDKIEIFNNFYNSALSELKEKESGNYCDDNDSANYAWEDVMSLLAKDKKLFWKYFNSL